MIEIARKTARKTAKHLGGVTIGSVVHYVAGGGQIMAGIVTDVWDGDEGKINIWIVPGTVGGGVTAEGVLPYDEKDEEGGHGTWVSMAGGRGSTDSKEDKMIDSADENRLIGNRVSSHPEGTPIPNLPVVEDQSQALRVADAEAAEKVHSDLVEKSIRDAERVEAFRNADTSDKTKKVIVEKP